jgi:hypothetical protein
MDVLDNTGYQRGKDKKTAIDLPHFGVDASGVVHQFLDTHWRSPQASSLPVPSDSCVIIENIGSNPTPTSAQVEGVRRVLQACARYHSCHTASHDKEWPEVKAER